MCTRAAHIHDRKCTPFLAKNTHEYLHMNCTQIHMHKKCAAPHQGQGSPLSKLCSALLGPSQQSHPVFRPAHQPAVMISVSQQVLHDQNQRQAMSIKACTLNKQVCLVASSDVLVFCPMHLVIDFVL